MARLRPRSAALDEISRERSVPILALLLSIGLALWLQAPGLLLVGCSVGGVWGVLRCTGTRRRIRAGRATTLDIILETGNTSFGEIATRIPAPDAAGFASLRPEDLLTLRRSALLQRLMLLHIVCAMCSLSGVAALVGGMPGAAWILGWVSACCWGAAVLLALLAALQLVRQMTFH